MLQDAQREGVVALVDWHLRRDTALGGTAVPLPARELFSSAARSAALVSMLFQAEAATVLDSMQAAGIPGLLLKGNALAYWAYAQPHWRECNDVDVLVPSRAAAEALAAQLCQRGYDRSETSGELVAYELMCRRRVTEELQAEVDVHWQLANSFLFANAFTFEELMADSVPLPALGASARGLGPAHACIHACVHRALNLSVGMPDRLKWLYDIELMFRGFGAADWDRVVTLSTSKGLAGVVHSALEAACSAFGRTLAQDIAAALTDAQGAERLDSRRLSDWRYMQHMTAKAIPTLGLRVRWGWQRLFPSRGYMSYLYGAPDSSYLRLVGTRLRKFFTRVTSSEAVQRSKLDQNSYTHPPRN